MTRIQKEYSFLAGVYFENKINLNLFDINMSMVVDTESFEDQNVANGRLNYFFHDVIEDCMFVNEKNTTIIDKLIDLGSTVCTLPDDPWDQVIGVVMFKKINSILEGRIILTDLLIGSKLGGGVKFDLMDEELTDMCIDKKWYNQPFPNINDVHNQKTGKKVVSLFKENWSKVNLNWKENAGN